MNLALIYKEPGQFVNSRKPRHRKYPENSLNQTPRNKKKKEKKKESFTSCVSEEPAYKLGYLEHMEKRARRVKIPIKRYSVPK